MVNPAGFILVVDDDRDIRESLVEMLEEHGCAAMGAGNGRLAMKALEETRAEAKACLILLDLMMPEMDGRAFREEQMKREDLAGIPVIVISACREGIEDVTAMKVAGHLQKPLGFDDVLRAASHYCQCAEGHA